MKIQAVPVFKDAHILRKSMLEALSDYAYLSGKLLHTGYGDGILSGCELTTTEDRIILNEGVFFYQGEMFFMKEPEEIFYFPTNTTTVLKLCISGYKEEKSLLYREMELVLEGEDGGKEGIELCRFKLQEGARLRYAYQDFFDRDTEFDTLNVIHAPYAVKGGSAISPEVTKAFAREMLAIKGLPTEDVQFCLQLLGREHPADNGMLAAYIGWREGKELKKQGNGAIFSGLARILKRSGSGEGWEDDSAGRKKWKMMVE